MKFITAILSAFFCLSIQAQLVTYPGTLSTGMPHNDDYTVRVRIPGGEWKDLFEYNVQVDMDKVQNASMVQFDMGHTAPKTYPTIRYGYQVIQPYIWPPELWSRQNSW